MREIDITVRWFTTAPQAHLDTFSHSFRHDEYDFLYSHTCLLQENCNPVTQPSSRYLLIDGDVITNHALEIEDLHRSVAGYRTKRGHKSRIVN